jgi:hypothetical protein
MQMVAPPDTPSPTAGQAAAGSPGPVQRLTAINAMSLLPPTAAGLLLFGFRGLLTLGIVVAASLVGLLCWRRVGRRGGTMKTGDLLWQAVVLALLLPPHLASLGTPMADGLSPPALVPALVAAGLLLATLTWLLGGPWASRLPAAVPVVLVLTLWLGPAMTPRLALTREAAPTGDLLDYERRLLDDLAAEPWLTRLPTDADADARWRTNAGEVLAAYTTFQPGLTIVGGIEVSMAGVIRDRLPPIEDLIILGHPAALGMASAAALLASGVFLFGRGAADARVGVLALASAYATFALAPVPASLSVDGPVWTWAIGLGSTLGGGGLSAPVGLTFVHYEMLAGPILFIAVILAPLPAVRPLHGRWRWPWAIGLGVAMAIGQRLAGPALGPLAALLAATLFTPILDTTSRARILAAATRR